MMDVEKAVKIVGMIRKAYSFLVEVENILDELNLDEFQDEIESFLVKFRDKFYTLLGE